jgi:polyisoprenoid-binding protein YceI
MTISRTFNVGILLAVLATSSASADTPRWKLDPAKSQLGFSGEQTGKKFEGSFARYTTDIAFDPDRPDTSRIAVTVDLASASTGDTQRDTAIPGKDWFDTAQFPQAKFETTAIKKIDANGYEATGNLTLRGVTKSVTLPFTLQMDGTTAHAKGHLSLVRTAFGVGQGAWASGQWVALEVGVDVDIVATREN